MPGGARPNSGHRPVVITRATGVAPVGVPSAPAWLPAEAKAYYRRTARELVAAGVATRLDGTVLAMHAAAWWRWQSAERALIEHGPVIRGPAGTPVASPYVKLARDAYVETLRTAVELGLTPSARGRVKVADATPGASSSPIAALMQRKASEAAGRPVEWWEVEA
jgi:P27 family predicted phage terminase small subunit